MCGIYGTVSKKIDRDLVRRATETLAHRGPDDMDFHFGETVALGHRRLSIIDLEGGRQPIFNETGTMAIVFNGEIYNYLSLKEALEGAGHRFATRSDTETILHAYEEYGPACVERLRGMFAFAIWDGEKRSLFVARDRLGIKPLFYAAYGDRFVVASEMKAILADPAFPRRIDETALAAYFTLSYIPAPLTIFTGIRKLEPGHTLIWKDGALTISPYWDIVFSPDLRQGEDTFIPRVLERLEESVRIRLMSEVPLGAFLSGGIDSSTVVALMARGSERPVNTFCIGFGGETGGYLDERPYARAVSRRYGTAHREYEVVPRAEGIIETIVGAFDEPFADDAAIPSHAVCRIARKEVTVALSGLGGDETFGGYERYLGFHLQRRYTLLPAWLRRGLIPSLVGRIPERADGHYTVNHLKRFVRAGALPPAEAYFGYLSILSPAIGERLFASPGWYGARLPEVKDLILRHFRSPNVEGPEDALDRVFYCDLKTYVPEDILAVTDRMSMQHGLEVRVPFLDHHFLTLCATIPAGLKIKGMEKKALLKKAVRPLLPSEVLDHRKQGFVGPMTRWLQTDLKTFTRETLSPDRLARHGLLDPRTVSRLLSDHEERREIHDTLIWALLVFQTWFDRFFP